MVISNKKRVFEEQPVASGVPPVIDHLNVTSKLSAKKFFGRKEGEFVCFCVDGAIGYLKEHGLRMQKIV